LGPDGVPQEGIVVGLKRHLKPQTVLVKRHLRLKVRAEDKRRYGLYQRSIRPCSPKNQT
jgi:hypothetical protein